MIPQPPQLTSLQLQLNQIYMLVNQLQILANTQSNGTAVDPTVNTLMPLTATQTTSLNGSINDAISQLQQLVDSLTFVINLPA
jgi:hypothetical protein